MSTIQDITIKYSRKLDFLDLELLIADSLNKTREFVLSNPEYKIPSLKIENLKFKIARRVKGEPIAYITGHKEFYGLDFIVNKHTLVPRPETEMLVEQALSSVISFAPSLSSGHQPSKITIIDIGTGSGNIITSIANELEKPKSYNLKAITYYATDISKEALKIAKKNAKLHGVDKKIKFLHGSLLEPLIKSHQSSVISNQSLIITANLPYLSKDIYQSAPVDVKKFEPKSALYSAEDGLAHYRKLLEQLRKLLITCFTPSLSSGHMSHVTCFLEISPEQKALITKIIKSILPSAKIEFQKDLAGKWRICKITL